MGNNKQYAEIVDVEDMRKQANALQRALRQYDKRKRAEEMPQWWETDDAKAIFSKMEAAGYCKPIGRYWEWQGTLAAWSFMARLMADKIGMKTKSGRVPYKEVAKAFPFIEKKQTAEAKFYKQLYCEPKDAQTIRNFFQ